MSRQAPRAGFTDVDRETDREFYVRCLEYQSSSPFTQMYKRRTFDLLDMRPGHRVLDVGCGLGQDVLAMAELIGPTGEAVGLDLSRTMIEEARKRSRGTDLPVSYYHGDAHGLPFADGSFDRCHADRTFQHLPHPERALAEMIRVTGPGGKLLIVEPDHETLVIDTPYREVTRRFLAFRSDTLAQGDIAHRLYRMFKEFRLADVAVEAATQVSTDYEATNSVMRFDGGIRVAQEHGVVTEEEADRWVAYIEEAAREDRFLCALTYFITVGRKPA